MKKRRIRGVLWGLTLLLMAVIFWFSAQPGEKSDGMSAMLSAPVTDRLASDQADVEALYELVDTLVRKTAHFCEYALLGMLLALLFASYGREKLLPTVTGTLYAVTDEVHQLFVPERAGLMTDVLLDGCGVFCGVLLIRHIVNIRRKKQC